MEQLLHYVWRHRIYPLHPLKTTSGQIVEVIDPGLPNRDAGPDFFNAKLKLDGILWVGNVEIHTRASDWMRHGHQHDKLYSNVILHIVEEADCDISRADGSLLPQLQLPCPDEVRRRYEELQRSAQLPPCHAILPTLSKLTLHTWLSALQAERMEEKVHSISERLKRWNNHWEDVFFITLARNFGFGLNGDAFERWASALPFRAVDKHRDNLFQVEALFFGQAGLLTDMSEGADEYYLGLLREYRYMQHKFSLPEPLDEAQWRLLRLRPACFPHVRLAQLAWLYHTRQNLFSRILEAETTEAARALLSAHTSPYWEQHYHFRRTSPKHPKQVGTRSLNLLLINTVVPFLYAYGQHKADELLPERANRFLEALKPEDNRIIRLWQEAGIAPETAADSQALIQLQRAYCERKECLRCRFGFEYLKGKRQEQ